MDADIRPTLRLTVADDRDDAHAPERSRQIQGADFSIGRGEQCDWVLAAKGISRLHAQVRFLNGQYFLEDRSTNGILRNGVALHAGEPVLLVDGDRLRIDTIDIDVAIDTPVDTTATAHREAAAADGEPTGRGAPATLPFAADPHSGLEDVASLPNVLASPATLDPMAWLSPADSGAVVPNDHASPLFSHGHAVTAQFQASGVFVDTARKAPVLPENWDLTRSQFAMPVSAAAAVEPVVATTPAIAAPAIREPSSTPMATSAPLAAPAAAPPAGMEPLFLALLEGVMDVLRARAELKNGFRMPATLIRRTENNPLKFAPTASEAMARILAPGSDAFLSGSAAIADAMDDIRVHQVALLAGVREAFEDLMRQFDPGRFEEAAGARRRPRFGFHGGDGPWERYRAHFERMAKDPEERFRRLFGDEFARAYEDQLARGRRSDTAGERRS
ncbi:type VI secretion system-associated FHA domain protein TagH [Luteibacter jiangsuensis]